MALGVPKPLLENEGKDDPAGIRTRVTAVKGRCLRPLDHGATYRVDLSRGEGIRTPGPMLPKHVRYQTALHPEGFFIGARHNRRMLLYAKPDVLSIAFLKKLQSFYSLLSCPASDSNILTFERNMY